MAVGLELARQQALQTLVQPGLEYLPPVAECLVGRPEETPRWKKGGRTLQPKALAVGSVPHASNSYFSDVSLLIDTCVLCRIT